MICSDACSTSAFPTYRWASISLIIPMDQPLARLAFILFDPRSDDGLMAWNILDAVLGSTPAATFYPVIRTMNEVGK